MSDFSPLHLFLSVLGVLLLIFIFWSSKKDIRRQTEWREKKERDIAIKKAKIAQKKPSNDVD